MAKKKVLLAVGARPNFMKMAPLYFELGKCDRVETIIAHTGQHYDYEMSKAFFEDLELPEPDYYLGVGSGTHAEVTAKIMVAFEKVLVTERPDLVVVFGDVNSTFACSITAKKLLIPVVHVEAGLRSFDDTMPEEINRKLTDAISDLLFTPSKDGNDHLIAEGVELGKIHLVGNIMIDSLMKILNEVDGSCEDEVLESFSLTRMKYALITLHRPCNVDNENLLKEIIHFLNGLSRKIPVVYPVHPRTESNMKEFGIKSDLNKEFRVIKPLRYREFIILEKNTKFVVTDSGGVQEETTYFGLPCLTLRPNTERPITVVEGTNELVDMNNIEEKVSLILSGKWKQGKVPELWDGMVARRVVDEVLQFLK
jgi:UDP-N-acetylglucosamine 2-epimerase (non-hydrolysing)